MADEAVAGFPEECCGILIGTMRVGRVHIAHAVHAANVVPVAARRRRFEIDPAVLIAVQKYLRGGRGGARIVGYFHSHPFGPARPSVHDLAGADEAGLVAIIVVPDRATGRVGFSAWMRLGHGHASRFRPLAWARESR